MAVKEAALKVAGAMLQAAPDALDLVDGQIVERRSGQVAHAAGRARPHRLLPRRHAAARPAARADADAALHHQANIRSPSPTACRPAGSRSTSTPAWCSSSSTGAWRTAAASSTRCWSTSRCAAASCRASAARSTSTASTRPRASCWSAPWPTTWCRWRPRCPTSRSATSRRRRKESLLGAKGAGEAGTAGAPAAVMNAINDALRPFGAKVFAQPFTPERILAALGKVPARWPEPAPANRRWRRPARRPGFSPGCSAAPRPVS